MLHPSSSRRVRRQAIGIAVNHGSERHSICPLRSLHGISQIHKFGPASDFDGMDGQVGFVPAEVQFDFSEHFFSKVEFRGDGIRNPLLDFHLLRAYGP
jgi:hypothetical protein